MNEIKFHAKFSTGTSHYLGRSTMGFVHADPDVFSRLFSNFLPLSKELRPKMTKIASAVEKRNSDILKERRAV